MSQQLIDYRRGVSQFFGVCVQILDLARSFDMLLFDMELVAKNGTVRAAKTLSVQGKPLIVLAEALSEIPWKIEPEIKTLELKCTRLFRTVALCSIAVRRYYQYTKTLMKLYADEFSDQGHIDLKLLYKEVVKKEKAHKTLSNREYFLTKSSDNLNTVTDGIRTAIESLKSILNDLERIRTIGLSTQYIATSIAINSAHFSGGNQFDSLVQYIHEIVGILDNKYSQLIELAHQGQVFAKKLIVYRYEE